MAHSQSGTNAPLSKGLDDHWTSDGGATNWATGQTQDATGNGYTGSLIAMSTSSSPVAGKIGQALKFNGANYTRVPSAPNLDIAAYTISGWVNGSNTNKDIISIIYSTAAAEQRIIINSAYVFISNDDNGLGIDCITSDVFAANKWHHFVAVQQSKSSRKLYVDGILECTSTYSNAAFS